MLQFPPALYHYITEQLHKQVILVLNKVDLCPPPLVVAWKHYMTSHFPDLQMVCFTSHPREPNSTGEERRLGHAYLGFKTNRTICWLSGLQKKRMRRKAGWGKAGGPLDIMKACQEITAGKGDPASQTTPPLCWAHVLILVNPPSLFTQLTYPVGSRRFRRMQLPSN